MGRPRKTPAEFPSDWHYEAHLEALAREAQGYQDRIAYLKTVDGDDKDAALEQLEGSLEAVQAQIKHYSAPSKRPKAEKAESR